MHKRLLLGPALTALAMMFATGVARTAEPPQFESHFATVVIKNCLACHGRDDPKGGLDLTRREGLLKGGRSGRAVVPGMPDESLLIERVTQGTMPPKKQGPLTEADVARLTAWVK